MLKEGKSIFFDDKVQQHLNPEPAVLSDKSRALESVINTDTSVGANCRYSDKFQTSACKSNDKSYRKIQCGSSHGSQDAKLAVVFKSKLFKFSSSFPEERVSFS